MVIIGYVVRNKTTNRFICGRPGIKVYKLLKNAMNWTTTGIYEILPIYIKNNKRTIE